MPIQRTLDDLEIFCIKLLDQGFKKEIGIYSLRHAIAKKFGYSTYIQRSTMEALIEFGLIKLIKAGRFRITVLDKKEDATFGEMAIEKEIEEKLGVK